MAGDMVHTVPASCPHLGLAADTHTRFDYPHPANRCHSQRTPLRVKVGFQATFCLGPGWLQCPLYRAADRRAADRRAADRRAAPTGMHYAGHQASWVPLGRAKRSMLRTALWAAGLLLTLLAAIGLLLNSFWAVG